MYIIYNKIKIVIKDSAKSDLKKIKHFNLKM